MDSRGDLAVEVGHAAVPALQKRMIRRARKLRPLQHYGDANDGIDDYQPRTDPRGS